MNLETANIEGILYWRQKRTTNLETANNEGQLYLRQKGSSTSATLFLCTRSKGRDDFITRNDPIFPRNFCKQKNGLVYFINILRPAFMPRYFKAFLWQKAFGNPVPNTDNWCEIMVNGANFIT